MLFRVNVPLLVGASKVWLGVCSFSKDFQNDAEVIRRLILRKFIFWGQSVFGFLDFENSGWLLLSFPGVPESIVRFVGVLGAILFSGVNVPLESSALRF